MERNNQTGNLKVTTPSEREITMTRVFHAPRQLLFDALTQPDLVKRWLLGPPGWAMPICEIDLKVGGAWRYVWRNEEKEREFGMHGFYREIAPPDRIVHTEIFEDGESLVTTLLKEEAGATTLTMTMLFATKEARDGALESGMADGVAVSYDRLEAIVDPNLS